MFGFVARYMKYAQKRCWFYRHAIWVAGATLILLFHIVFGSTLIVSMHVWRASLADFPQGRLDDTLFMTHNFGGLPANSTLKLLNDNRLKQRRAAAHALSVTNNIETISDELWAFANDPDPHVQLCCLESLARNGDRKALLEIFNISKANFNANPQTELTRDKALRFASLLSRFDVREAGDEIIRQSKNAEGKIRVSYIYDIEKMLQRKGFLGKQGVLIDGTYVSTFALKYNTFGLKDKRNLSPEKVERLLKAIPELWEVVRLEFHPIANIPSKMLIKDWKSVDWNSGGTPSTFVHLIGWILFLISQLFWAVAYLAIWKFYLRRFSAAVVTAQPDGPE